MPSSRPTSSFDSPCANSPTPCLCREVMPDGSRSACMAPTLRPPLWAQYRPKGVSGRLLGRGVGSPADERRLVAPLVRGAQLLRVQRPNPLKQLELVTQMRPHHL